MKKPQKNKRANNQDASPLRVPFSDNVGKTLRRTRLSLELSLDDVAAETRIQKPIIKSIEKSDYDNLPHSVQTAGFIKRYARLLGLNSQTAASKYLLERGPLPKPESRPKRQRVRMPIIGTKLAGWLIAALSLLSISAYLIWQLAVLTSPPRLVISQPEHDQIVYSPSIEVSGTATPGAEVIVNSQIVYVDDDGGFSTRLSLSPGLNVVRVEATNRRDQTAKAERNVLFQPPE